MRRYPDKDGHLWLGDGDYGQHLDGVWEVRPPGCHIGELDGHTVTEHEDGTVTVEPSIRAEWGAVHAGQPMYWHGYLIRGEWRKA